MTREQKFEARLEELGLTQEWENQGRVGRVATTDEQGNIILLIHEDDNDNYSEIHYPPFEVLRRNYKFVKACILEWKGYDEKFEAELDDWLAYGAFSQRPCPLCPVDVYFPADGLQTSYEDFEDDQQRKTFDDLLDDYYTGEPKDVARMHLWELLNDIDMLDGFRGGVWGPDDIMDNLEHPAPGA